MLCRYIRDTKNNVLEDLRDSFDMHSDRWIRQARELDVSAIGAAPPRLAAAYKSRWLSATRRLSSGCVQLPDGMKASSVPQEVQQAHECVARFVRGGGRAASVVPPRNRWHDPVCLAVRVQIAEMLQAEIICIISDE